MKRTGRILGCILFIMIWVTDIYGASAPKVVVPKCNKPPVIDGRIEPEEWRNAFAGTGFIDYNSRELDLRQAVVYTTWDDENIYFAFQLPIYPKGAQLYANCTQRDRFPSDDDVLELLIDPHFGKYQAEDKYVQFMGNSADHILYDQANHPIIGLFNILEWDGRWQFKNQVDKEKGVWYAELSLPLSDLGIKKINDGDKWLVHFSRLWGAKMSWTTFSPAAATLDTPGGAAELIFRKDVPAVKLYSVSPLLEGKFGFSGEIRNNNGAKNLKIESRVSSGSKEIYADTMLLSLKPDETKPFSVLKEVALEEKNVFYLKIYCPQTEEVYYEAEIPFLKSPAVPVFPEKPKVAFLFQARYLPSSGTVWIDEINVSGKKGIEKCLIEVARDEEICLSKAIDLKTPIIRDISFHLDPLKEGKYSIKAKLLDIKGKEVASEKNEFAVNKFPFEGNNIGVTDEILPPFTPIILKDKTLSVWGRKYQFNALGLFDQITASQPEPTVGREEEKLLASPVELVAGINQKQLAFRPIGKHKIDEANPHIVKIHGAGKAGELMANITTEVEYDGMARTEIVITPDKPVSIEKLTLRISLAEEQATLLHEITDSIRRVYAGETPKGKGAVWDSSRIRNSSMLGTFKPMYWLGNEDRGLCWFAETDRGWILDDKKPAIEIIREKGSVILQVNFINKQAIIEKPIKLSFGIQATPVKLLPAGWRSWVAPYSSPEFNNLKYFYFGPVGVAVPSYSAYNFCPYPADWEKAKKAMDNIRNIRAGTIPFLYEMVKDFNPSIPEHKAYKGEWGRGATYAAKSFADFKAWALNEYLDRAGLFAFYEDNSFLSAIKDPANGYGYYREDGQYQGEFPIFKLRELLKREAAIYHKKGLPNYVSVHKSTTMMPPIYSFAVIAIDGEQRFMVSPNVDYIDQFPLDYIRAHIMGRQFGFVPFFLDEIGLKKDLKEAITRGSRSEYALLLLHEIVCWPGHGMDPKVENLVVKAKGEFDIGRDDVIFHPYWAKDGIIKTGSEDIKVSFWQRPGRILVVVANIGKETDAKISIDFERLNISPQHIKDFESNEVIVAKDKSLQIKIPRHDFRLIWIE